MFDATSPFHSLASLERVVMGWLVLKAIVRPIPLPGNEIENASVPIGADAARRENAVLNFMSTIRKRDIMFHLLSSWILMMMMLGSNIEVQSGSSKVELREKYVSAVHSWENGSKCA